MNRRTVLRCFVAAATGGLVGLDRAVLKAAEEPKSRLGLFDYLPPGFYSRSIVGGSRWSFNEGGHLVKIEIDAEAVYKLSDLGVFIEDAAPEKRYITCPVDGRLEVMTTKWTTVTDYVKKEIKVSWHGKVTPVTRSK